MVRVLQGGVLGYATFAFVQISRLFKVMVHVQHVESYICGCHI